MNRHRQEDLFEQILASLHAGVLDDARWPAASGLIAQFCYRWERHVQLEREYFGGWHAVDERLPRIRALPDSRLAPIPSLFNEDEMKTSAVYNELMPRTDTRDSLSVRLDGPERSRIVWTICDPVDAGPGRGR